MLTCVVVLACVMVLARGMVLARVMVLACVLVLAYAMVLALSCPLGVGHTVWAPEGRKGRSQAVPKGRQLEVGAQLA